MSPELAFIHCQKHLLAHVLVAAGARHWPGVTLGRSGETAAGFFADFGIPTEPSADDLEALSDGMARLMSDAKEFREIRLGAKEALALFSNQPWKQHHVSVLAESDHEILCSNLDGIIDLCDCRLKTSRALHALHPEKFLLTDIEPVNWEFRGHVHRFTRVSGELFPAVAPCDCCRPD